MKAPLKRKRKT